VAAAFSQTEGSDTTVARRLLAEAEARTAEGNEWTRAVVDMSIMAMDSIAAYLEPDQAAAQADLAAAIARGQRAATVFRRLGEPWAQGVTLGELGRLHHRVGDLDAAEACFLEALSLFDESDYHGAHYVYTSLGHLASSRGHHERAERYHRRSLEVAEIDSNPGCVAYALAGLAHATDAGGDQAGALDLYRRALDVADRASLKEHGRAEWEAEVRRLADAIAEPG
jgi:tetratricopeptide (TPR) repeat protein